MQPSSDAVAPCLQARGGQGSVCGLPCFREEVAIWILKSSSPFVKMLFLKFSLVVTAHAERKKRREKRKTRKNTNT